MNGIKTDKFLYSEENIKNVLSNDNPSVEGNILVAVNSIKRIEYHNQYIERIMDWVETKYVPSKEFTLSKDTSNDLINIINDYTISSKSECFRILTDPIIHNYILIGDYARLEDMDVSHHYYVRDKLFILSGDDHGGWIPELVITITMAPSNIPIVGLKL